MYPRRAAALERVTGVPAGRGSGPGGKELGSPGLGVRVRVRKDRIAQVVVPRFAISRTRYHLTTYSSFWTPESDTCFISLWALAKHARFGLAFGDEGPSPKSIVSIIAKLHTV